ncbi:hypothetical protein BDQ12DRAFT_499533 [Crucibulum laeve]|uniref:Uncharacterized protein n=1 Tax=Crucibulum laeve TaxID=68775 RepID=A0A5C3LUY9_9AGAR|nr:hypothetical protein BDQ12DRAFT_499533 [Crucibulum laeve]
MFRAPSSFRSYINSVFTTCSFHTQCSGGRWLPSVASWSLSIMNEQSCTLMLIEHGATNWTLQNHWLSELFPLFLADRPSTRDARWHDTSRPMTLSLTSQSFIHFLVQAHRSSMHPLRQVCAVPRVIHVTPVEVLYQAGMDLRVTDPGFHGHPPPEILLINDVMHQGILYSNRGFKSVVETTIPNIDWASIDFPCGCTSRAGF